MTCSRQRPLFLSRFAIGIATVALGLSGGLVLDHARDALFLGGLTCFDFSSRCSIGCRLLFGGFGPNALLLLELHPFPFGTPCFPGLGYG